MYLDSHQHFWRYEAREFDWIDESMAAIRRDFLLADLAPVLALGGVDGTIAVQARQSVAETDWLLKLAGENPRMIRGVVGWLPLREQGERVGRLLEERNESGLLKGVRHVLQGEPDAYMADADFNAGVGQLAGFGLSYDLLVRAPQLPSVIGLVDRHPDLPVVLDHGAKPVVQGAPDAAWMRLIRELARRPQVGCKLSGLVTEVPGWKWTVETVRPYFDTVLEAFGADRLMFGSDWPVCLVATPYAAWLDGVRTLIADLSADEQTLILGGTAARFYRLESC